MSTTYRPERLPYARTESKPMTLRETAVYALYAILTCTILYLGARTLISGIGASSAASNATDLLRPYMSNEQIAAEHAALERDTATPLTSVTQYRTNIDRFAVLESAIRRALAEGRAKYSQAPRAGAYSMDLIGLNNMRNIYVGNSGNFLRSRKTLDAEMQAYEQSHPSQLLNQPEVPTDWSATRYWFGLTWLIPIPLVMIHYLRLIRKDGGRIVLELSNQMFYVWSFFWLIGMFRYPNHVSIAEQYRKAKRTLAFALSTAMSLCAAAKTPSTKEGETRVDQTKTWTIDLSTTAYSKYLGGNGAIFKDSPVQQTTATATRGHFYLGMFHSAPYYPRQHPDFGFEVDGSAGLNYNWLGFRVNNDLTFIATSPLRRVRGDVLQLTGSVYRDFKLSEKQTLSAGITINHASPVCGARPKAGFFLRPGFSHALQISPRFALNSSVDMTRDVNGAFGFNPAWIARVSTKGSFPLNKNWSIQFPVLLYDQPLSHVSAADGRKRELILGGGLSFHR